LHANVPRAHGSTKVGCCGASHHGGFNQGEKQQRYFLRGFNQCGRLTHLYVSQRLAIQYYLHNRRPPKRILFLRDGGSDGSFGDIISKEVPAIRKAFYEIKSKIKSFACPNREKCQQRGCLFCTPPITFVVAQNEHHIRVVPAIPPRNPDPRKPENVPSGTVVDSIITGFRKGLTLSTDDSGENTTPLSDGSSLQVFSSTRQDCFDFLLTAHGGLKGPSKPVYYRVLVNENSVCRPDGYPEATALSKRILEKTIFQMAFQCESNLAWQLSTIIGLILTYVLSSSLPRYRWYGPKGAPEGTRNPLQ
jgi:hypothetical protein